MTIIELAQGRYRDLTGTPKTAAVEAFAKHDAEFLEKFPSAAKYHRPGWREFEAPDTKSAPWGHEWYRVAEDGTLQLHSAQYDSSD